MPGPWGDLNNQGSIGADESMQEPTVGAPLLYQIIAALQGRQAQRQPVSEAGMGLVGGRTNFLPGARQAIPDSALQQVIRRFRQRPAPSEEAGYQQLMRSGPKTQLGTATQRQARNPLGAADAPSAEYAASTEAPGGRAFMGGTPQGVRSDPVSQYLDDLTNPDAVLKKMLEQLGGSYTGGGM